MKNAHYILAFCIVCLTACRNTDTAAERAYKKAVEYHKTGSDNEALFYYQSAILACIGSEQDSLDHGCRAMCGQGDIWMQREQWPDARMDYETAYDFASRHHLDTLEYIACRRLAAIAYHLHDYEQAISFIEKADKIGLEQDYNYDLLKGLDEERLLYATADMNRPLSDSLLNQLDKLAQNLTSEYATDALRHWILHKNRTILSDLLPVYLEREEQRWRQKFQKYTERSERGKRMLMAERDAQMKEQRDILFVSLLLFVCIIGYGIFLFIHYRQQDERKRFRLILHQKDDAIRILEQIQKDSETMIQRNLKERREQEQNWRDTEQKIRTAHLFELEIGRCLPAPGNPHEIEPKDFINLFVHDDRKEQFIKEFDSCFNNFASGLAYLTPDLTLSDIVICCLYRLDVRNTDIASMFSVTKAAISIRRKRMEKKMCSKVRDFQ